MSYAAQTARYLENDVLSRSPEWLVPLMYEHLLAYLRRAEVQMQHKDAAGRLESLAKASAILGELLATLDREQGGEIASGLASLYAWFAIEILNLGRSNDAKGLRRIIQMVEELHEAWQQAAALVSPTRRSDLRAIAASAA